MNKENTVRYYIGDPNYIMKDRYYHQQWGTINFVTSEAWDTYKKYNSGKSLISTPKNFIDKFVVTHTLTGDGCYEVKYLNLPTRQHTLMSAGDLPVDSGCIGIVEESLWKEEYKKDVDKIDFGIVIQLQGSASDYELNFRGWHCKDDDGYREYTIKNIHTHEIIFRVAVDTNGFLFTTVKRTNSGIAYTVVTGHTYKEWHDKFQKDIEDGNLWDILKEEVQDGAVEPFECGEYWELSDNDPELGDTTKDYYFEAYQDK